MTEKLDVSAENGQRHSLHTPKSFVRYSCSLSGFEIFLCNSFRSDNYFDLVDFQVSQTDSSTMELLETPFSQTLSELIDLHLKQHHSIPVFLASVTVDLFNKQTIPTFSVIESTLCAD